MRCRFLVKPTSSTKSVDAVIKNQDSWAQVYPGLTTDQFLLEFALGSPLASMKRNTWCWVWVSQHPTHSRSVSELSVLEGMTNISYCCRTFIAVEGRLRIGLVGQKESYSVRHQMLENNFDLSKYHLYFDIRLLQDYRINDRNRIWKNQYDHIVTPDLC